MSNKFIRAWLVEKNGVSFNKNAPSYYVKLSEIKKILIHDDLEFPHTTIFYLYKDEMYVVEESAENLLKLIDEDT